MKAPASSYWRSISNACHRQAQDAASYRMAMLEAMRKQIEFDAYCFTLTDPLTLLSTGALTAPAIEHMHDKLLAAEYAKLDQLSYEEMVRNNRYVVRLHEAAGGKPQLNQRYTELLEPEGFSDELRAALFYEGQCWGFLTLFKCKTAAQPIFTETDEQQLEWLVPIMGEVLKQYYYDRAALSVQTAECEQGFLLLSGQLQVLYCNERGKKLLRLLQQAEQLTEQLLPKPLQALGSKLLADHRLQQHSLFIPLQNEGFMTIKAAYLQPADASAADASYPHAAAQQQIVVTMQPASPASMLPYLMQLYGLTPREQQMVYELLKGSSNKQIASQLAISGHTVQDHLKAIFAKVEVSSRSELIWKLHTRFSAAEWSEPEPQ